MKYTDAHIDAVVSRLNEYYRYLETGENLSECRICRINDVIIRCCDCLFHPCLGEWSMVRKTCRSSVFSYLTKTQIKRKLTNKIINMNRKLEKDNSKWRITLIK